MRWFNNFSSGMNRGQYGTSDLLRSKHRLRLRHYASKPPERLLKKIDTTSG